MPHVSHVCALCLVQLSLYLAHLQMLVDIKWGLQICPIDECPHLKHEWDVVEGQEDALVHWVELVHQEVVGHGLRSTKLYLQPWKSQIDATYGIEYRNIEVLVHGVHLILQALLLVPIRGITPVYRKYLVKDLVHWEVDEYHEVN